MKLLASEVTSTGVIMATYAYERTVIQQLPQVTVVPTLRMYAPTGPDYPCWSRRRVRYAVSGGVPANSMALSYAARDS